MILFQSSEETGGGPWSAVSTHGPWTHHTSVRSLGCIDKGVFKDVIRNLQAQMLPQAYSSPERRMVNFCLPGPIHLLREHPLGASNKQGQSKDAPALLGVASSSPFRVLHTGEPEAQRRGD